MARRTFDRNFKLEILQQAKHRPMAELCREHNLNQNMVLRWKRELEQYPKEAFKGKGNLYKVEAQLAESQRLIGQLYAENALLKKAIQSLQEKEAEEKALRCTT
jgi:transposase-like protein